MCYENKLILGYMLRERVDFRLCAIRRMKAICYIYKKYENLSFKKYRFRLYTKRREIVL
jgi:hypothetical protein